MSLLFYLLKDIKKSNTNLHIAKKKRQVTQAARLPTEVAPLSFHTTKQNTEKPPKA